MYTKGEVVFAKKRNIQYIIWSKEKASYTIRIVRIMDFSCNYSMLINFNLKNSLWLLI